jgi:dipeptidyl aminopeptidase/acylaminoacyl peptidase
MMPSVAELLERESRTVDLEPDNFERLLRRRDRKRRNRRLSAGALAVILALVSFVALTRAFRTAERPADQPPAPKPPGIFSEVGGWIAYGDDRGIWAVDPTRPGDPNDQIQLSTDRGTPLAWSSDGSKLLILSGYERPGSPVPRRLFVLNADGTETHLTTSNIYYLGGNWSYPDIGGSFSPDGSQVIYANKSSTQAWVSVIYVVDTQGGTPRVLQTASRRWFSVNGRGVRALPYNPTYSPDGTQIAYFDGAGDSREGIVHQLRVMNADGSGTRVLVDDLEAFRIYNLAWSPDGERLAFGLGSKGIYIVGADGSGLTLVIPGATYPYWSPDGSRISYQPCDAYSDCQLQIADADGTHVVEFDYARSGPWNPLVQPEPEVAEVPAASEGLTLTSTLVLVVALLALVVGVLVIRRRMGRDAGNAI